MMFAFLLTSVVFADNLQNGSKGTEVKKLQQQLKSLGYFKGEITGYFGSVTEAAVKSFQKKSGLGTDGIVGSNTYKKVFEQSKLTAMQTEREKIIKIQQSLIKLGLYNGKTDGINGTGTTVAIKKFQAANQLEASGSLNAATEKAILSDKGLTIASRGNINRQGNIAPSKDDIQPDLTDEIVNEDLQDDTGSELDINDTTDSSKDSKLEPGAYLDWWEVVRDEFSIGATAQVIDYRTGKTFNIKRTYGTNHADAETLTKEDTAIMKELWGGKWSWTRRPVIIVLGERRIAASIAAMPHAGRDSAPAGAIIKNRSVGYGTGSNLDKIKGNNMDGHFDVHFLNSRTHGTNRKDTGHQNAIREAAGKL
jgi:peptidoglycan hydrolase-like protein with peptidoglycan-binding domain